MRAIFCALWLSLQSTTLSVLPVISHTNFLRNVATILKKLNTKHPMKSQLKPYIRPWTKTELPSVPLCCLLARIKFQCMIVCRRRNSPNQHSYIHISTIPVIDCTCTTKLCGHQCFFSKQLNYFKINLALCLPRNIRYPIEVSDR